MLSYIPILPHGHLFLPIILAYVDYILRTDLDASTHYDGKAAAPSFEFDFKSPAFSGTTVELAAVL